MTDLQRQLLRPEVEASSSSNRPWDNNYETGSRRPWDNYYAKTTEDDVETGKLEDGDEDSEVPPCCGGRCSYHFCGGTTLLVVVALSLCTYFVVLPSYVSSKLVSCEIAFDEMGLRSSDGDQLSATMSVSGRLLNVAAIPSLITSAELRAGHTTIGLDLEGSTIGEFPPLAKRISDERLRERRATNVVCRLL